MAEYIERGAVHNLVRSLTKYAWTSPVSPEHRVTVDADEVNFGVDKIPAADVAPVRHGQWVADCDGISRCSLCWAAAPAEDEYWDRIDRPPYCHNCGAKMDLTDQTLASADQSAAQYADNPVLAQA